LIDPEDISGNPQPITDAIELSTDDVLLLATLLLDVESWFFACKRCVPKGTAVINLTSHTGEMKLLIGMSCLDWEIRVDGYRQGGFFDPVADQVRGILKRSFPEIASPYARSMWTSGAISKLKQQRSLQPNVAEQSVQPELPNSRF
jgi:hypothetical protein